MLCTLSSMCVKVVSLCLCLHAIDVCQALLLKIIERRFLLTLPYFGFSSPPHLRDTHWRINNYLLVLYSVFAIDGRMNHLIQKEINLCDYEGKCLHYPDLLLGSFLPSGYPQCQTPHRLVEAHLEWCSRCHLCQNMKKPRIDDLPFLFCLNAVLQQWTLHNQSCHCYQHLPVILEQALGPLFKHICIDETCTQYWSQTKLKIQSAISV